MSRSEHLIELLRTVWNDLDRLAVSLTPAEWRTPVLPGWDVQDTLAHILGTETMLEGGVDHVQQRVSQAGMPADRPHVRNPIGATNEAWVEHFRAYTPDELLVEFRATTAGRLAALEAMSDDDFAAPSWTPAGPGTYASFMRIRVFDCWMHDQDIRYATDRPGGDGGPAAEESLAEVMRALGYIVGKRGGAPQGSLVCLDLTGPVKRTVFVDVTDRARLVDKIDRDPDVTISLSSALFMRLGGGRVALDDVADDVRITGDAQLGRRIAANLAFTV